MKSTTCCENALPVITDVITKACCYAFHPHTLYMRRMLQYLFMKNLEFGHYGWSAASAFDFPNPLADAQLTKKPPRQKCGAAFYFYKKASDYAVLFLICEMITIRCIYYYTQAQKIVNTLPIYRHQYFNVQAEVK